MKRIRFIHAADLHLDSPFKGLSHYPPELFRLIRESTFTAFSRIVDAALENRVDFLLLAGDLFDGEDRSIKAQAKLKKELDRLRVAEIPVYAIHGNHDHLAGNWLELELSDHVHIFGPEVECMPLRTANDVRVHIYGFSYPERHIFGRKADQYVKKAGADFHIALLHGQWESGGAGHPPYAPFSVKDLLKRGMDYWALGHIHQPSVLHEDPPIIYSGNIQGRHANETGEKGCFLVELTDAGESAIEMIPASSIIWDSVSVECTEGYDLGMLLSSCLEKMEAKKSELGKSLLLDVVLNRVEKLDKSLQVKLDNKEFLELLQEEQDLDGVFCWPHRITPVRRTAKAAGENNPFSIALGETACKLKQEERVGEAFSSLYAHPHASRYLERMGEEEMAVMLETGKKWISLKLSER